MSEERDLPKIGPGRFFGTQAEFDNACVRLSERWHQIASENGLTIEELLERLCSCAEGWKKGCKARKLELVKTKHRRIF